MTNLNLFFITSELRLTGFLCFSLSSVKCKLDRQVQVVGRKNIHTSVVSESIAGLEESRILGARPPPNPPIHPSESLLSRPTRAALSYLGSGHCIMHTLEQLPGTNLEVRLTSLPQIQLGRRLNLPSLYLRCPPDVFGDE